jgi:hypothetical protein
MMSVDAARIESERIPQFASIGIISKDAYTVSFGVVLTKSSAQVS